MAKRLNPKAKGVKNTEIKSFTQDFVPISDIRNGVVITKDNKYVKIVEIEPINFDLRSTEEQLDIIIAFASYLKICNSTVHFKCMTNKADSEKYIQGLMADLEKENDKKVKQFAMPYIELIRDVGSKEALTRRFFLIFEYEPKIEATRTKEFAKIKRELEIEAAKAEGIFKTCGNNVIIYQDDEKIAELYYTFYNRRSSKLEPFDDRVNRVIKDTMIAKGRDLSKGDEVPKIPVTNFIAPRGVDLTNGRYMIMDGLYYSFLYIRNNGYPKAVNAGWMRHLINAGEGIDIDVFYKRESRNKARKEANRKVKFNKMKMGDLSQTSSDYEEVRDAIIDGSEIKDMLSSGQDLFYCTILVTIMAYTLEDLYSKKEAMKEHLMSSDLMSRDTSYINEEAFNSVVPLTNLSKFIEEKSARNMLTDTAAAGYMFTSFEMSDENGLLLGVSKANNSLCIIDLFNTKLYNNANMTICGMSGSGKTFGLQSMATRFRQRGGGIFIIAPIKGEEFIPACINIGGQYINLSPTGNNRINVMEIRIPKDSDEDILLDEETIAIKKGESLLAKKINSLKIFFKLLDDKMDNEQEQYLDECLIRCYASKGINHNNKSLYDRNGNLRKMPILGDLLSIVEENKNLRRLASIMKQYVTGSASIFNGQTNVDLDNKYIVFDISSLSDTMLPIGMFLALDFVWDKVKEDRTKKQMIIIDEGWKLIGAGSNVYAADYVLQIFKTIRSYRGSAVIATQDMSDFMGLEDGKYGMGIISASVTKMIYQILPKEAQRVKEIFELSESEVRTIKQFSRGEALISVNNNKVPVEVKASQKEVELITTDGSTIEANIKKKEKELEIQRKMQEELANS